MPAKCCFCKSLFPQFKMAYFRSYGWELHSKTENGLATLKCVFLATISNVTFSVWARFLRLFWKLQQNQSYDLLTHQQIQQSSTHYAFEPMNETHSFWEWCWYRNWKWALLAYQRNSPKNPVLRYLPQLLRSEHRFSLLSAHLILVKMSFKALNPRHL